MEDHPGLTTKEAEEFQAAFGFNEVKPKMQPEWQKIAWRYLDWVSLVIVRAAPLLLCRGCCTVLDIVSISS